MCAGRAAIRAAMPHSHHEAFRIHVTSGGLTVHFFPLFASKCVNLDDGE